MDNHRGIADITPLTLLDFPDRVACILWFTSCNLRCKYCYNASLVNPARHADARPPDYRDFLSQRAGFLDAVVLSGGECTLCPDFLDICRDIKARGLALKVDTNGTRPDVIRRLLDEQLCDYIALDYKAPEEDFATLTGKPDLFTPFSKTLDILIHADIPFEVRTTIHPDLLPPTAINTIIADLSRRGYQGTYHLQHYFHTPDTLGQLPPPTTRFDTRQLTGNLRINLRNFPGIPPSTPLTSPRSDINVK